MSDTDKNQTSPFCMRLSQYARQRIFGGSNPPRRTRGKAPVKDHAELARVLSALGHSRMSSNLNQLAMAVNTGNLLLTPEQTAALLEACADTREMRQSLMKALGQRE